MNITDKFITGGLGASIGFIATVIFTDSLSQISSPIINWGEWVRLAITTFCIGVAGFLAYKNQDRKRFMDTIDIQTRNLQALDTENKRFKEELIQKDKENLDLKRQVDVYKVKTDLTQVMEMIGENNKASEERYTEAMDLMNRMLMTMDSQTKENTNNIGRILQIIDKRWKIG